MSEHKLPNNIRIVVDGNGNYWAQTKGTLWGWNNMGEHHYFRDGSGSNITKYFKTKEDICAWVLDQLDTERLNKEHHQRSKQIKVAGPC